MAQVSTEQPGPSRRFGDAPQRGVRRDRRGRREGPDDRVARSRREPRQRRTQQRPSASRSARSSSRWCSWSTALRSWRWSPAIADWTRRCWPKPSAGASSNAPTPTPCGTSRVPRSAGYRRSDLFRSTSTGGCSPTTRCGPPQEPGPTCSPVAPTTSCRSPPHSVPVVGDRVRDPVASRLDGSGPSSASAGRTGSSEPRRRRRRRRRGHRRLGACAGSEPGDPADREQPVGADRCRELAHGDAIEGPGGPHVGSPMAQ